MKHVERVPLLVVALLLAVALAQTPPEAPRITELRVDAAGGDEGDLFLFRSRIDNPSGSLLNTRWDFGDGTVIEGVTNLSAYRHRYRDDGDFTVTLEVALPSGASDRRSVTVSVANVAPEVKGVERSSDPLKGAEVVFTASVVDPGDDALTFSWDFGDGTAPVVRRNVRHARHSYRDDGAYRLTLTVADDAGDETRYEETVLVGEGFTFDVQGVVRAQTPSEEIPALTGVPVIVGPDGALKFRGDLGDVLAGENPAEGRGICLVRMGNRTPTIASGLEPGVVLGFSAALADGLEEGSYPIAGERNELPVPVYGPGEPQLSSPGAFFARLSEIGREGGMPTVTDFHGTGGSLTVHRYDGDRIEATFEVALEQSFGVLDLIDTPGGPIFPPPRTAAVRGTFVHDVERDMRGRSGSANPLSGATYGDWYLCDSNEPLAVVGHDMGDATAVTAGAAGRPLLENLPWERDAYASEEAKLEFAFDRAMLRSSLNDATVVLEVYQTTYAATGEPFMPVYGTVRAVDERTFRFLPDADLRDGVIYQMTLRGGREGVRGASGETLAEDYRWTFATRVEVENVEAHTFQVARDAPLVPAKPTLTRVYPFWTKHADLPDESQVERFPADVTVRVDGAPVYPPKRGVLVTRPDLLSAEDRRLARNSVNFFGWEPERRGGSSTLTATLEPSYQPQTEPERVESAPLELEHWDRTPIVSMAYAFLRVGAWSDGVPQGFKVQGHRLMQEGALFTTQNFPVIDTQARYIGEIDLAEPPLPLLERSYTNGDVHRFYGGTYLLRTDTFAAKALFEATLHSRADIVVGIVPGDYQLGLGGVMVPLAPGHFATHPADDRVILLFAGKASVSTVPHELGHAYGLCHVLDLDDECPEDSLAIQGFRIRPSGMSGANKSFEYAETSSGTLTSRGEGNGDGGPLDVLMSETGNLGVAGNFINNLYYHHLFSRIPLRDGDRLGRHEPTRDAPELLHAQAAPTATLRVTGFVDEAGGVVIDSLRWLQEPHSPRPGRGADGGPYRLELQDAEGRTLAERAFAPFVPQASDGPSSGGTPLFVLELPAPAGVARLLVKRDGRLLAERVRSPGRPEVTPVQRGRSLAWEATDADDDELRFDLYYAPDGSAPSPLALGLERTTFDLPDDLEPGPAPTLRLVASDGFDTAVAELPLDLELPLRVLATSPADGDVLAAEGSLMAFVNADLDPASVTADAFRLETDAGAAVAAAVTPLAGGRGLMLTPTEALEPGRYRARLAGLRSRSGAELEAPLSWTATVGADAPSEAAADATPPHPDPCGGVVWEVVAALLPEGHALVGVSDASGCEVEATVGRGVAQVRSELELTTLRAGYRPTRNARQGETAVLGFGNAELTGEARLEPDGSGTRVRLVLRPK